MHPRLPACLNAPSADYEQAATWNRDVVALERLACEASFCLPDYLRWSIISIPAADAVAPDVSAIDQLIRILGQAADLLDHPAADSLPDVRRLRHELEIVLDPLRTRVLPSSNTISAADTNAPAGADQLSQRAPGLIASEMRLRLAELPDLTSDPVAGPGRDSKPMTYHDPIGRLRQAARLYAAAVLLSIGDLPTTDKKAAVLAAAAKVQAQSADPAELQKACNQFGDALADLLQAMPNAIQQLTVENQDFTDPDPVQRSRQIRNLRAARRLL